MKAVKNEARELQLFLWGVGVAIFVHVVSFMGVAYFDQNIVNWYMALAMVAAAYQLYVIKPNSEAEPSDIANETVLIMEPAEDVSPQNASY